MTGGPNTALNGPFPGHSGPVAAPGARVGGNAPLPPPAAPGGPDPYDDRTLPVNTPEGQIRLGARDLIAGEAFGDK